MPIPIRKLFLFFSFCILFLIVMHFFPQKLSWTINNRFDLNTEANVPTWYSTVLLFSVSLFSIVIHFVRKNLVKSNNIWSSFWLFLSCVYCFLSLDEASRLHEILDQSTSIKWVYVYAPFGAIFFVLCFFYFWVIRGDNKNLLKWFVGGLLLYAAGGLLSEFISYKYSLSPMWLQVEFVFEEGLEMLGTVMVLMGCCQELNDLNALRKQREKVGLTYKQLTKI